MINNAPSQITIISAILNTFGDCKVDAALVNKVAQCATAIVDEARRPRVMARDGMTVTEWLGSDDTGLSSKYLCSVLSGAFTAEFYHPHDADDFGRCYRLLKAIPSLRSESAKLKDCPAPWPALYNEWPELEKLYEQGLEKKDMKEFHKLLRGIVA